VAATSISRASQVSSQSSLMWANTSRLISNPQLYDNAE
jgi:hypothetical protein